MLSRLRLELTADEPGSLSRDLPDQLHGCAMALLRAVSPAASSMAHDAQRGKPISCSPLLSEDRSLAPEAELVPGDRLTWYLSATDQATAEAFAELAADPPEALRFGRVICTVAEALVDVAVDPAERYDYWIEEAPEAALPDRVTVNFNSPTVFRGRAADGRNISQLWPESRLLVSGLARRWNQLDAGPIDLRLGPCVGDGFDLAGWAGRSVTARIKARETIAFVGSFRYRLLPVDLWQRVIMLLLEYATLAGVGARTAHGFGWVTVRYPTVASEDAASDDIPEV